MTTNVYAKFGCAALRIKKALGIFRELITTTTRIAFWDPPTGSKNHLSSKIIDFPSLGACVSRGVNKTCHSEDLTCHRMIVIIAMSSDNSMRTLSYDAADSNHQPPVPAAAAAAAAAVSVFSRHQDSHH